ncbi:MAG: hypothetical protein ACPLRW_07145 [Moorellales bacterium]
MGNYLDLDALVPEDITVKLGGQEYRIPADLDLETSARLISLGKKLAEDPSPETVRDFEKFLADLLGRRQKVAAPVKLTMAQAIALINAITSAGREMAEKAVPFAG